MRARPVAYAGAVILFLILVPGGHAQVSEPSAEFAAAVDFGQRFFQAGNYAVALNWFEKAELLSGDHPAVLYDTALVLARLQRYDEAQRRLDRYVLLYPKGAEIASVTTLQQEVLYGVEVRRSEQQNTEYRTLFSRARALSDRNLRREALNAFHQAEQIPHPDDPSLPYDEAVLTEEEGDLEGALRLYNRYLQSNPLNGPELQARLLDLEREIGYTRTKLICPFCGSILPAGARWCHHCWHGPYDVTSAGWNARACDAHVAVTRSFLDARGKTRLSEPVACAYPGATLRDYLQYSPAVQSAVREARKNEGWTFTKDGLLESRHAASSVEVALQQGESLQRVDNLSTGEVFSYRSHPTADGIWLLDGQPFTTGDQLFLLVRVFDGDGRLQKEEVSYGSTGCHHAVAETASYSYAADAVTGARFAGSYDGYRAEGSPQVRWEATLSRTFDSSNRLTREELSVTSFQKVWGSKPEGAVSDEVRRYYPNLKVRKPTDIRALGDVCAFSGGRAVDEAIDLRPFFVVSPALAVRLAPGDSRVVVEYSYSEK